jgi:hypothetical protein
MSSKMYDEIKRNLKEYFETPCSILSDDGLSQEHTASRFRLEYILHLYIYLYILYTSLLRISTLRSIF